MTSYGEPRTPSPTESGLKLGDKGRAVGGLQRYLAQFGYLPLHATVQERIEGTPDIPISEVFDDETAEALRAYQAFSGIPTTGKLDDITVGEMAVPRCGVPDIWRLDDLSFVSNRFVLSGRRWTTFELFYAFENYSQDSTRIRINRAMSAAFRTWANVTSLTFHQRPVVEVDLTQIRIRFAQGDHGDANPFDDAGTTSRNVIAHAFYPPVDGVDPTGIQGDVHFDDFELWNTAAVVPTDRYDLQSSATHEIGHALGLRHSTERGAIMWRSLGRGVPKRTLHQDDIDGILAIYALVRVPFVQELSAATAAASVRAADLVPRFTGTDGPNSWVWRQSPNGGTRTQIGNTVTMQLRTGPRP